MLTDLGKFSEGLREDPLFVPLIDHVKEEDPGSLGLIDVRFVREPRQGEAQLSNGSFLSESLASRFVGQGRALLVKNRFFHLPPISQLESPTPQGGRSTRVVDGRFDVKSSRGSASSSEVGIGDF